MAVTNGWGKGVDNNTIGWGKSADNATNGFGAVYGSSAAGDTLLESGTQLLLDSYSGAAAAYSVRKLSSSYSGSALRVRRSSDNAEQDIGFSGGDLDTNALEEIVNVSAPLLDTYSGAAAAYSVRKLSSTYSGSALRVRRSSDNAEQDIGFVGNDLDTTTMESFCGAGDGYVTTWYDQSGNGLDATQSTAASQPQIVSSGSTLLDNTKPSLVFDGTNDFLQSSSNIGITGSSSRAMSLVLNRDIANVNDYPFGWGDTGTAEACTLTTEYFLRFAGTTKDYSTTGAVTNQEAVFIDGNGANLNAYELYLNGTAGTPATASNGATTIATVDSVLSIGAPTTNTTLIFDGKMQEAIFWGSSQSSNRTGIEQNINNYFSIYTQDNDGFVTTWYDQSGNGNDATQTTAANQPQIVSSGSTVTQNGKVAIDFDGTDDYLVSSDVTWGININGYAVCKPDATSQNYQILDIDEGSTFDRIAQVIRTQNTGVWRAITFNTVPSAFVDDGAAYSAVQTLASSMRTSTGIEIFANGSSSGGSSITGTQATGSSPLWIGIGGAGLVNPLNGNVQEAIVYNLDGTANRTAIEALINTYYEIY